MSTQRSAHVFGRGARAGVFTTRTASAANAASKLDNVLSVPIADQEIDQDDAIAECHGQDAVLDLIDRFLAERRDLLFGDPAMLGRVAPVPRDIGPDGAGVGYPACPGSRRCLSMRPAMVRPADPALPHTRGPLGPITAGGWGLMGATDLLRSENGQNTFETRKQLPSDLPF
jgi:hypothetical protein